MCVLTQDVQKRIFKKLWNPILLSWLHFSNIISKLVSNRQNACLQIPQNKTVWNSYQVEKWRTTLSLLSSNELVQVSTQVSHTFLLFHSLFILLAQASFFPCRLFRHSDTGYIAQGAAQWLVMSKRVCSQRPLRDFEPSSGHDATAAADSFESSFCWLNGNAGKP